MKVAKKEVKVENLNFFPASKVTVEETLSLSIGEAQRLHEALGRALLVSNAQKDIKIDDTSFIRVTRKKIKFKQLVEKYL